MTQKLSLKVLTGLVALGLLAACSQTASPTTTTVEQATETPAETVAANPSEVAPTEANPTEITPTEEPQSNNTASADVYEPLDASVCQALQETASQALDVEFTLQNPAPFQDEIAGEAGQGCRLTAGGDGSQFSGPDAVVKALVNSIGQGWDEQIDYEAGGPTGEATGLVRDMGLMLISAEWSPAQGVECPSDQPIASCTLTPEQEIYTIQVNVAQYKADFSLDGHWEDAVTGFSLDLTQEWKNISGGHTMVAQNGAKIDSLEDSIQGKINGKVADVTFKSSFSNSTGEAEITSVDANTITWKILTPPDGEYYLPAEATLTRK